MRRIKKKKERPVTHDQWIEITRKNGEIITKCYPPNAEFERLRQEMDPPPSLIYRRLNFVHGVPEEYSWCYPPIHMKQFGGHYLLRLTTEDWLDVMQRERRDGNQRVLPSKSQRRPAEFGPCPCDRCTAEREAEYANL